LIDPEFTRKFCFDSTQESEWAPRASWRLVTPDGRTADAGEVIEIEPQKRLVLSWQHQLHPEARAEGFSRMTYELEQAGDVVKLTVPHQIDKDDSKLINAISGGWPMILASLKSLLETGESLEATRQWPKGF
jgi:uncharacterized protein YndB with AHSA1/START domain